MNKKSPKHSSARIPRPTLALAVAAVVLLLAAACGELEQPATGETSQQSNTQPEATATNAPATPDTQAQVRPVTAEPAAKQPQLDSSSLASTQTTPIGKLEVQAPPTEPSPNPETQTKSPEPTAAAEQTPVPVSSDERSVGGAVGDQAPQFTGISTWINSEPLTMENLRGQVVLIDFWTYTCVNCIRTFPYLREWHAKYADKGLVIVGVHTPEFEFEKVTENVERNAGDNDLVWPIAQDNDYGTWSAYSNRFWPAKYLIDQAGTVRYTHFGEGAYVDTEKLIRQLLEETGADLGDIEVSSAQDPKADPTAYSQDPASRITRELYGGYTRNNAPQGVYVAHVEYYQGTLQTLEYTEPGDHQNQFFYLQGPWINGSEKLRHARETEDYSDYIALKFVATSVNAVIEPDSDQPFEVQVTIDGRPLLPEEGGADLVIENGRSFFRVDQGRMYEVVSLPEFGAHELKLSSNSSDFALFAFTFGAYPEGP